MGYATPWLKNKAYAASDSILFQDTTTYNNNTDVYVIELQGVISEALIQPSMIRFTVDFNNQVDFKVVINNITVWSNIANYGGWTTVSYDIPMGNHLPMETVTVEHKRNGAFGAVSSFRNFSIRGTVTPIILS